MVDRDHIAARERPRHGLGAFVLCLALLAGCQTNLPAPRAQQEAVLRALGFMKSKEGWTLNLAAAGQFDNGKDTLRPDAQRAIVDIGRELLRAGVKRVRVEGHTDNIGSRDYNIELSRRRADAVARYLTLQGFASDAIARKACAFDHPIASNDTPAGRAQNRRVAIVVLAPDLRLD
jgi:outer membrane protein OmpA-like peptidoglycan-associated protein